ncbi:hypothetical protein JX265_005371 [Neoarthrinium moseri]|uniref:Pre-mRNA splicing factor CLF1 n=1 Tax=Neoarthrinium moseri TaxID=1658444 RepID=A0A9Q0AMQ2_9PEZI|nr:uncharacterized protein JN550_006172 [Neoarthrinium moseri]KAI1845681.1 hypothetical protein JX266_008292 [Neoarthrinium moseri]KAI1868597.1 hypothetical protein JN550_006172 [Neoarthrinium moseri]KAI1872491.1 hypothetical protein JX265_005371 [Neoarthrinium moseri]
MPLPQPNVTLDGACSVIHDNVLYSYSSAAFQSLSLEEGAEWKTLGSGKSVVGGVCVGSTPVNATQAGLYIVGGTSSDANYTGLQKFTYSTGKWEAISPQVAVTQSRIWHSAVYLQASDKILVYAGSQDGIKFPSTQTFTIGASAPFDVSAYESIAPPVIAPILLPWSETDAVLVGGDATNLKVMLFNPDKRWYDSGSTLANPIVKDSSMVKATIVTGDDGSKHLYTFDLSTSPNTVNRTVLLDGKGAPVLKSAPVKPTSGGSTRRDLDANNWPDYNSTLAPEATRTEYSLASASDGVTVMSGGNKDDILCIFDTTQNSWQNATQLFVGRAVTTESEPKSTSSITPSSSSTSISSTPVAASTQSPTTAAAAAASSGLPPTSILGIALGVIFGCAIILIALLFLMKRKRQKQAYVDAGHARRASGIPEKQEYLPRDMARTTGGFFPGHSQQESQSSFSSMAILMGKAQKPGVARKPSKDSKRSSASSILNRQFKSTISRPSPIPEPENEPRASDTIPLREERAAPMPVGMGAGQVNPRPPPAAAREDGTRRSSGWNRYWSGGSTMNMMGFGNGASRRETQASEPSSQYTDMHRMTQDSATVPPLQVEDRPAFYRVQSGSPTVSYYANNVREGQSAEIQRPVSNVSSSGYSSGIPPSVDEAWDPTIAKKPWGQDRAPSSAYSQSTAFPTGLGAPGGPSRPPTGVSRQPQLTMASTSDMSWLNLGENGHNRQSQ